MKSRYLEPPILTFDPGSDDEDEDEGFYADRWSTRSPGLISRALSPSFNKLLSPFRKTSKLLDGDEFNDYGTLRKNSFWDRLTPDSAGFVFRKSSRRNMPRR